MKKTAIDYRIDVWLRTKVILNEKFVADDFEDLLEQVKNEFGWMAEVNVISENPVIS